MPVVTTVFRPLSIEGGFDMFVNPVGTAITGMPTRFPMHTLSQSVALPINASILKPSLTSRINFPRDLCA